MPEQINIGTSGWSYKQWRGLYYPEKMKAREWLLFYTQQFNTTEVNTSFYHLPKGETIKNWVAEVPKDFLFCPKMSRYLTHMKKLLEPEDPLKHFFEVFRPMKKTPGASIAATTTYGEVRSCSYGASVHLTAQEV
jgi:uncharacterized protein YecE (DUF72 family)